MLKWLSDVFWTDSLWLPPGIKWTDLENSPEAKVVYPDSRDFNYQLPLVVALLILRFLLEKYCFKPVGCILGIREKKKRKLQQIPLLETAYCHSAQNKDVTALAKQLDLTERQVERWWRLRRNQDKTPTLSKFCEHCWKGLYFSYSTCYGFYMLWDKDWFWDYDKCYIGYPHQGITRDLWWYYMMNTAFILATITTFFRDTKRKDHWQMFVHHIVAAFLICGSWMTSFFRIGAVLMLLLDSSEALLEITKAIKKAKYNTLAKVFFIVFVPIWFYTRLYLFPQFLYSTSVRASEFFKPFFAGCVLNVWLYLLLILTIYWSLLILRVVYNFAALGVERDVRSSSSEATDDPLLSDSGTPVQKEGGRRAGTRG